MTLTACRNVTRVGGTLSEDRRQTRWTQTVTVRSYLCREQSATRASLGLAVASLLMLFLVAQVIQLNISVTLALALFALVAAIISVSLGMYGVLRTKRWPFRLVNAVAVVASLFAILAWGSLILTLASGCLGVMC